MPRRTRHVAFLRSPHAHARIGAVDASQARELAGVRAVFTGEDFRDIALRARSALPGYVETAQPVLAPGRGPLARARRSRPWWRTTVTWPRTRWR